MKTKKNKISYRNLDDLVVEHLKKEPDFADLFLKDVLEEYQKNNDENALLNSLRQLAIAKGGFTKLAKVTHLSRESLYKALSPKGNPRFHTLKVILEALGYKLELRPNY